MSIIEEIFNIFAPHECLGCKKEGSLLCEVCAGRLNRVPSRCYGCKRWGEAFRTCKRCRARSPLFSVWSVTSYEGIAKELVHALKFARAKAAADAMARTLIATSGVPGDVLITHVPTANTRIRERGYDQAALLARTLSKRLGLPYLPLVARTGEQRQLGQQRDIRKKQMEHAFRALEPLAAQNKHILLVDDVLTTGATCEAAARTLRKAGARRVSAAVFAVA